MRQESIKELMTIPGVGRQISKDLFSIGIRSVADLKDKNPEKLYQVLCKKSGFKVDRCMLYVFRCAVYYSGRKKHDPRKLQWWNWKD